MGRAMAKTRAPKMRPATRPLRSADTVAQHLGQCPNPDDLEKEE